jgi:hypothetical protein
MRYCIGCIHLDITPRDAGCTGSTLTGVYGDEEAMVFCKKGHWREEMGERAGVETFRKCMEKAETCPDFNERPSV